MRAIITLLTSIFITITGFTQHVIEWEKSFGGSGADGAYSFQKTTDGGYIVAGYNNSTDGDVSGNHGLNDFWILKFNSAAVLEWQKSLGGSLDESAASIQQTLDGGYIIAGNSKSNDGDVTGNHGDRDFWVVKITATGVIEWQKSLGGSLDDGATSVQQTLEGGYIIAGYSKSNDGDVTGNHGGRDFWIVKVTATGVMEWQKSLGGSLDENALSIQQSLDGGYIVAGDTLSNDGDVTGNNGTFDIWIVKLTNSGNLEWEKTLGGPGLEGSNAIQQTSDGDYIVAGYSTSNSGDVSENFGGIDYWIIKLTNSGLIEWQKSFGGSLSEYPTSIQQTLDGGYIIGGESESNDGNVTENKGLKDFWVVKITASGTLEWEKSMGGSDLDIQASVLQVSNDDYIVVGNTFSNDGDVSLNKGLSDIWIVKLTPFLNVDDTDLSGAISLYPNPNNGQFYLELSSLKEKASILIIDVLGRLVYTDNNVAPGTVEIDQNFASGMYVVSVSFGSSEINLKMIVE